MKKENIALYIVALCFIMQFVATSIPLGRHIYTLIAAPLAVYYFPVKPLLKIIKQRMDAKHVLYILFSCWVVGVVIALSAIRIMVDMPFLRTVTQVFLFLNMIIFGIEASKNNSRHNIFLHFLIMGFSV
ncbi:MAG: hypothetical protein LBV41_02400 [Cytophagaceae bacterium]|nr:hypothetical protein [Cytophagaceae bacterium]